MKGNFLPPITINILTFFSPDLPSTPTVNPLSSSSPAGTSLKPGRGRSGEALLPPEEGKKEIIKDFREKNVKDL